VVVQHHNFTLLKTTLIGLGMSGLCAIGLFYFAVYHHALPRNGYIWSYEFNRLVTYNPLWWITVLGSFVIAFVIARKTRRMTLWIALTLTGCVALYLAFCYSLRYLVRHLN
jgi:FtsH-binding integral membrane protein